MALPLPLTFTLKGASASIIEAASEIRHAPESCRFTTDAGKLDHVRRQIAQIRAALEVVESAL